MMLQDDINAWVGEALASRPYSSDGRLKPPLHKADGRLKPPLHKADGRLKPPLRYLRAKPTVLFLLAVLAFPSCRGKHAPPPGFVKPALLEGAASLVVRIGDGAWQQASPVEDVERFEAVAGLPWLLAAAQISGGCPPEMKAMCGEGEEMNPLVVGPCDEGRDLASFPLEAARELLEKKGFVYPEGGEAAAWPACKDGKEEPILRINAVRLSRILRDLFSKKNETLDDRIVNFIVTSGRVRRSGDGGLCGLEFESEGSKTWTAGWAPCESPRSVMAVFGEKSWEKAMDVVAALEL